MTKLDSSPFRDATRPLPPPSPAKPAAPERVGPAAKKFRDELDVMIRARYPIIYVVTFEEERVEQALARIAATRNKKLFLWTYTQGIYRYGSEPSKSKSGFGNTTDPLAALDTVMTDIDPAIYIFKDFHPFTDEERSNLGILRRLKDLANSLRDSYKTIVLLSPCVRLAPELMKDVALVEMPPPGVEEFAGLLERIEADLRDKPQVRIALDADAREQLLNAALGLTLKEAENAFAKTIVSDGKLDADDINAVFSEKQQIIKKSGLLEYYGGQETLDSVGGLENLKTWLKKRTTAFTRRAQDFGLPPPRGLLLLGVQGCGKSLCAKAAAGLWKMPLLRFDIGRMFGSLVGSSEENMRRAIFTAESVAPAILWVDEIDKAFSAAAHSGASDGGAAARVFGTFLTWLSEKTSPVFVIATANNISHLPPELLRKGRLDEIFFVDLPGDQERHDILKIHLARRKRDPKRFELARIVPLCDGFSGAEIEQVIISGLFDAFSAGTDLNTEMLEDAFKETVPLSRTMSEEMVKLRTWAKGRARLASLGTFDLATDMAAALHTHVTSQKSTSMAEAKVEGHEERSNP